MGRFSACAKLEILNLLSVEDTYQLRGTEVDYLMYLTEGNIGGLDLKQSSTAEGYDFAVSSSLYPLLDVSDEDSHLTATPFGKLTHSPLKQRFLRHLLTLHGDVAFVDAATGWTVPVIIDHFLNDQSCHFAFSSLTITRSGCVRWPSADVTYRPCVTCSHYVLQQEGSFRTADETYHFDASHSNRRLSICVTYRAEPVWDGRSWRYCFNRLDVLRLCLRFAIKTPCISVAPSERRATRIGTDVCCDVFGYLGRLDVDSCRLVCVAWDACCLANSRSLPLYHVLQATEAKVQTLVQPGWAAPLRLERPGLTIYPAPSEPGTAGPVRRIEDAAGAVSYLENSYIRLLKLDFDSDLTSDVLNAMENSSRSPVTWKIGTVLLNFSNVYGLNDNFLARVDDVVKPAHYRVQLSSRQPERVEHIRAVFSRSLFRQRGFRLVLQWPGRYQHNALLATLRRSWMEFALYSSAPYISVVYVDSMLDFEERPFSMDQLITSLLEKDDVEGMAEEVELIALRPRLLSLPQRSGELIAEVIDKEHVVFPPVSHASRPLNLQIFWLGGTRKNLTLAVGMDGTDVMVMRLYRGHVNAREIRERALRSDRANNFVELMPD